LSKKWLRLSQQVAGRADARMGGGSGWKGSVRPVCVCVSVSSVSLPLRLPSFASSLLPASASAPRPLLPCLPLPACLPPASAASGLGRALSIALNFRARADSHRFICKRRALTIWQCKHDCLSNSPWLQLMWLQFEVVRGLVGVVWGRCVTRLVQCARPPTNDSTRECSSV
jgi:hypothetical protein